MTQCIAHARKVAVLVSVVLLWSVQASFAGFTQFSEVKWAGVGPIGSTPAPPPDYAPGPQELAFLAAAGPSVVTESFEDILTAPDQVGDLVTTSKFTLANLVTRPTDPQDKVRINDRDDDVHASNGLRLASWDVWGPDGKARFNFEGIAKDMWIDALGFTLIDPVDQIEGQPGTGPNAASLVDDTIRLQLTDSKGNNFNEVAAQGLLDSSAGVFFGVISDHPFQMADLLHSGLITPDGIGIDQVYFRPAGAPFDVVPEPVTLSLAALGVLAIGGYARKRRGKRA